MKLTIVIPEGWNRDEGNPNRSRLEKVLTAALWKDGGILASDTETRPEVIDREELLLQKLEGPDALQNRRILFAFSLDAYGRSRALYDFVGLLRRDPAALSGSVCGLIIDGCTELYTKAQARELSLAISMAGGLQVGKALCEGTGSLKNHLIGAKNHRCSPLEAYVISIRELAGRVLAYRETPKKNPKILCIHASDYKTSNTLNFWSMVRDLLPREASVKELSLRNGTIEDCSGCPFEMCMHFSDRGDCYYGGNMVKDVYPAVEACDALVMLCPNYNDAISANHAAFINRLTSLYRRRQFYEKKLFAVAVSGYSGSDLVVMQLLNGLGLNKSFIIPPYFAVMETANAPKSILGNEGIEARAKVFAEHIYRETAGIAPDQNRVETTEEAMPVK